MSVYRELDELMDRYDCGVRLECQSECAWSGELWMLYANPPLLPARSIAFHAVGAQDPERLLRALVGECNRWLSEAVPETARPLPVQRTS